MKDYGLAKKLLKLGYNQVQNCIVAAGRVAGVIDFPVPPNSSMRKTGGRSVSSYYIGGLRTSLPIMTCARREGVRLDENIRVLDFGCGVGRPLLHFTRTYPAPSFYACDIDDTAVTFIAKNYPQVHAYTSRFTPPLSYAAEFFDMIYSVSIFSHLNMDDQAIWLKELARITKRGGYVFLSTEGFSSMTYRCREMGADEGDYQVRLEKEGFIYREYQGWQEHVQHQKTLGVASLLVGIERSYGTTILSPDYIRRHWPAAGFEVCAVVEGVVDGQDLAVLRRS